MVQGVYLLLAFAIGIPSVISDPGFGWESHHHHGHGRVSTCAHPGYFVNPHDCTRFFRCVDHSTSEGPLFTRYDFDCPHGTIFNEVAKVCTHARDGGCGWGPPVINDGWGWSSPPIPISPSKGWGGVTHVHKGPVKGPTKGRRPVKGGPPGGWNKGGHAHHHHVHTHDSDEDHHGFAWGWGQPSNSNTFWSFSPTSSYVVVYDSREKSRPVDLI